MDKWFKLSPFHGDDTSSNLVWVTVCVADLAMLQIVVLAYVGSNPIVHLTGLTVITYGDINKGRNLYTLPLLLQFIVVNAVNSSNQTCHFLKREGFRSGKEISPLLEIVT